MTMPARLPIYTDRTDLPSFCPTCRHRYPVDPATGARAIVAAETVTGYPVYPCPDCARAMDRVGYLKVTPEHTPRLRGLPPA